MIMIYSKNNFSFHVRFLPYLMTETGVQNPALTLDSSLMNEHGMGKRNYSMVQLDGILSLLVWKVGQTKILTLKLP